MAYVSPAVDQATRTFPVEVLVDNADRQLKPGFFAKGVVLTTRRRERDGGAGGRDLDAGRRVDGLRDRGRQGAAQQVTLGARQGKLVEITSGLKGDEIARDVEFEPARDRRQRSGRQRRRTRSRTTVNGASEPAGAAAAGGARQ